MTEPEKPTQYEIVDREGHPPRHPDRGGEVMALTEKQQAQRNLNPHAEAILAMNWWSDDYAFKQRGGSMDFWDSLPVWKKKLCRDLVKRIRAAETAEWSEPLVKQSSR